MGGGGVLTPTGRSVGKEDASEGSACADDGGVGLTEPIERAIGGRAAGA